MEIVMHRLVIDIIDSEPRVVAIRQGEDPVAQVARLVDEIEESGRLLVPIPNEGIPQYIQYLRKDQIRSIRVERIQICDVCGAEHSLSIIEEPKGARTSICRECGSQRKLEECTNRSSLK